MVDMNKASIAVEMDIDSLSYICVFVVTNRVHVLWNRMLHRYLENQIKPVMLVQCSM